MSSLDEDVASIENSLRAYFQTMKKPQIWTHITNQTGISLDRPSAVILHILIMQEPQALRLQDLAGRMGVEPPFVTRKTQQLEESGYLKRVQDPVDKRAVCLKVTAKGRKVAEKLWAAQRQTLAQTLRDWPEQERRQLVKLFEKFSQDLTARFRPADK